MYTPVLGGVAVIVYGHHLVTGQQLVNTFYLRADMDHAGTPEMAAALQRVDTYWIQQYRLVTHYQVIFDRLVAVDISVADGLRVEHSLLAIPGADLANPLPTAIAPILKMSPRHSIGRSRKNRMFLFPVSRDQYFDVGPNWWGSHYVGTVVGAFRRLRFQLGFEMHWQTVVYSRLLGEVFPLAQNDIDIGPILGTRAGRRPNHGR